MILLNKFCHFPWSFEDLNCQLFQINECWAQLAVMNSHAFLEFEDLLQRQQYRFDFFFAFKNYEPWKVLEGNDGVPSDARRNIPTGYDVKELVMKSAALDHTIRSVRIETGQSEDSLRREAEEILDLMSHNQTYSVARIIAGSVYWFMKQTFNNVFVNETSFKQVR